MKIPLPKPDIAGLAAKVKGMLPGRKGGKAEKRAEPDEDIPAHLRPTFFQRNSHLMPAIGTYAFVAVVVAGTAVYLLLNGDKIEEELKAGIPKTEVSQFEFVDRSGETAESATEQTADHSADHAAEQTAESSHGDAPAMESVPENQDAHAAQPEHAPATETADAHAAPEAEAHGTAETADAGHGMATEEEPLPPASDSGPDAYAGTLAAYPDPGLVESIETVGDVPVIGQDGREPWKVYARPSSSIETRPRIAVVITNLGLMTRTTETALAMPGPVSLSFSPYSGKLEDWIKEARDAGHEVLLDLPMEPRDFPRSDAGLLSLMTAVDSDQNILNLNRVMSEGSGYIGLVNYQGSGFTASRASVQPMMQALAKRGLVYLDSLENATSVAPEEAARFSVPHATADLLIDQSLSRAAILARLSQVELVAKTRNSAIIVVQPVPMLLDRVDRWMRGLADKGIVLTPLSGVILSRIRGS